MKNEINSWLDDRTYGEIKASLAKVEDVLGPVEMKDSVEELAALAFLIGRWYGAAEAVKSAIETEAGGDGEDAEVTVGMMRTAVEALIDNVQKLERDAQRLQEFLFGSEDWIDPEGHTQPGQIGLVERVEDNTRHIQEALRRIARG